MVIDDEPTVLEVISEAFELVGLYTVTANNGQLGINIFRQQKDAIDLVILDLQMPHMSGEETLKHLLAIKPDVQVLLSSGYSEVEMEKRPFYTQIAGFLQKPYDMDTLLQAVVSRLEPKSVMRNA